MLCAFCVAGGELSCESNPCVTFHRPNEWHVTCSVFGLQGGGVAIIGTATLTNTNVYSNECNQVRSPKCP